MRQLKPRTPPKYDNRIHMRADYDLAIRPDEPPANVRLRTRMLDQIGLTDQDVKRAFLRIVPAQLELGGRDRESITRFGGERLAASSHGLGWGSISTIWFLGGQSYSINDPYGDPRSVADQDHDVLQAFVRNPRSMSRSELEKASEIRNVAAVMTHLAGAFGGLFAPAIRRPGRKARGGYYIRVRVADTSVN